MASICVFCGAQSGDSSAYSDAAFQLGTMLSDRGHRLVYGGGSVGMMGTVADQVLATGGDVIGVIPDALAKVELMHSGVSDMRVVPDMHSRKALMHELADGYIALPGGYGTMEELFEVLCWGQLDIHEAPIALLNVNGLYDGLIQQVSTMVKTGFLTDHHRSLLNAAGSISELEGWLDARFSTTPS